MKIKIRKFRPSDLNRVMEIEKVSFPEPWPESYFKEFWKKHPDGFMVAEISKKIVGYVLGYKKPNGLGSIKTIAVDLDYRRQGIGKELVNFIINKLKKESVKEIFLHVRPKNKIACKFYKNMGFKILKTIKKYYRNGEDAYLMRKN